MIGFLVAITREAGDLLLTQSKRIRDKKKGSGNWVTDADLASERHLIESIKSMYPSHAIFAEETHSTIAHPEREAHLWLIDPLDGTTNFRCGVPFFAVSVAYAQRGIVQYGAIYDPVRGELFFGERRKGAYLGEKKIHVCEKTSFSGSLIDIGSPYTKTNFEKTYPVGTIFHGEGARIVNLGSAALECAYVACGRLSLYYEVGLKPWDIASGSLLIEEAGGTVADKENSFTPFHFERFLAGNPTVVGKAQNLIHRLQT